MNSSILEKYSTDLISMATVTSLFKYEYLDEGAVKSYEAFGYEPYYVIDHHHHQRV